MQRPAMKRPVLDAMIPPSTSTSVASLPPLSSSAQLHRAEQRPPRPTLGSWQVSQSVNPNTVSYLVSASGAVLSLGDHYHVTSSGVREFRDAANLGIASTSTSGLSCTHVEELDFDRGLQIGRGSSGKVYSVLHTPSNTRVCVKQMLIDDAHHRDEVKRELDSLHAAPSRWVVDFYGAFFHHDLAVILLVLELMDGSLYDVLKLKKRLTERETKALCYQTLKGLEVLHNERSLIHRDMKPANLLFHHNGAIKITDFGVSRAQRSHEPNSVHTFVGSISYMSPKRLEGKAYGYECDIWSLGIMLCECVSGRHPFQEDSTAQLTFWDLLQTVLRSGGDSGGDSVLKRALASSSAVSAEGTATVTVSDDMDDFVSACLAYDRAERASAEMLLAHPWMADMTLDDAEGIFAEVAASALWLKSQAAAESQAQPQPPSPAAVTPVGKTPEEDSRARTDNMLQGLMDATRKK